MRILLNGEGEPIPPQALPDELPISDRPPLAFLFGATETFPVEEYRLLGYTNFEVVCVGGAGGRGGASLTQLAWSLDKVKQGVPQNIWDLVVEQVSRDDYLEQSAMYNFYRDRYIKYSTGVPGYSDPSNNYFWAADATPPVRDKVYTDGSGHDSARRTDIVNSYAVKGTPLPSGWSGRAIDAVNSTNPTHQLTFTTLKNVKLTGTPTEIGGAGGGGGLHKVGGLLADLPDNVVVVVGGEGVDAEAGQTLQNGVITPALTDPQFATVGSPYYHYDLDQTPPLSADQRRIYEISNILTDYTVTYPDPHPSFPNPQKGGDGGSSSFGDMCKASGGEGGDPAYGWPGGVKTFLGFGGDGGAGNSLVPGGGGAGSSTSGAPGSDGTWDGTIGKGGGGGLSGRAGPVRASSPGGRGSYSFADPSRYGPRQAKSGIVPGGGGGALVIPGPPAQYYGSDALGSSPKGAVYLRITKVD